VPILLFFNELSNTAHAEPRSIDQAMAEFVELLRTIRGWRGDTALVTEEPLKLMEIAPGYSIQQWIARSSVNLDRWRFIRAIQNRAPYRSVLPDSVETGVEYRHDGYRVRGIGAAHLLDGLAVSLPLGVAWGEPWIAVLRLMLAEDERGEVALREEQVDVRHASLPAHAVRHKAWVQDAGREHLTSGAGIWDSRAHHFPHLTFLPRVEGDLRGLSQDWVRPVVDALLGIERAVADWSEERTAWPEWKTKVSGDSESRRHLCWFDDLDGITRIFELHARLTPGVGRLHFRLVAEDRSARVAYIGRKLGI